ncbi:hypothetical protein CFOL_v3_14243 [Cephalotus follicularis]|uniref:IBH1-like N-terminal domain-containing protein n=1 Tax=Cephalotus follicularis TaxID=3775 RepID=A0A1Q3BRZ6_CEPFO|nr:hypothetical protein CFOL_v3_14243 [Cephalotus follicularis]
MNNPKLLSLNSTTSLISRFTRGFIQALIRINKQRPVTSSSPREMYIRHRRIKSAADKSMALAVRSRRNWSRAVLARFRKKRRRHVLVRRITTCAMKKRGLENKKSGHKEASHGQANELRRLVPGGEAMDLCSLLEETAHYLKCLNTQVQVMRCVADSYSTI